MPLASLLIDLQELLRPDVIAAAKQVGIIDTMRTPGALIPAIEDAYTFTTKNLSPANRKYLSEMPQTVQESIRAALVQAIDSDVLVQLTYSPAVAYAVRTVEWGAGAQRVLNVAVEGPADIDYGPLSPSERLATDLL